MNREPQSSRNWITVSGFEGRRVRGGEEERRSGGAEGGESGRIASRKKGSTSLL